MYRATGVYSRFHNLSNFLVNSLNTKNDFLVQVQQIIRNVGRIFTKASNEELDLLRIISELQIFANLQYELFRMQIQKHVLLVKISQKIMRNSKYQQNMKNIIKI